MNAFKELHCASNFFKPRPDDAAQLRKNFVRLVEEGLLPHVLEHLEPGDLFKLASSCKGFHGAISDMYSQRIRTYLSAYFNDVRVFWLMLHTHQARLTGLAVLDIVLGHRADARSRPLDLCLGTLGPRAFLRYLYSYEGYNLLKETPDLHERGEPPLPPEGLDDLPYQHYTLERQDGARLHVRILEVKDAPSTSVKEDISAIAKLTQYQRASAWANSLSFKKLTVYYPDLTFKNTYHYLALPNKRGLLRAAGMARATMLSYGMVKEEYYYHRDPIYVRSIPSASLTIKLY